MSLHAKGVNYGIYSDEGKCSHHTRTTYQTTMLHEAKGARACVDVCVDVCVWGGAPLCLLVFTTSLTTTTNLLYTYKLCNQEPKRAVVSPGPKDTRRWMLIPSHRGVWIT